MSFMKLLECGLTLMSEEIDYKGAVLPERFMGRQTGE